MNGKLCVCPLNSELNAFSMLIPYLFINELKFKEGKINIVNLWCIKYYFWMTTFTWFKSFNILIHILPITIAKGNTGWIKQSVGSVV